ncbi:hypothetical protein DES52_11426 [Deinococcus yavapaiensis KR-236]|uniref:Phage integrase family protein n=1 Tax=Deinococcus yavapaiensis KR-236 TaxID=694435 RepID=A0A318S1N3_9DEIO|nr:hypothetical protein DES52_11426 [Deinococcus yavapaiensis KR-236]
METTYRIHDLRHTFVTRLIEAGADPKTTADLVRLTLSPYTRAETRKRTLLLSKDEEKQAI